MIMPVAWLSLLLVVVVVARSLQYEEENRETANLFLRVYSCDVINHFHANE